MTIAIMYAWIAAGAAGLVAQPAPAWQDVIESPIWIGLSSVDRTPVGCGNITTQ